MKTLAALFIGTIFAIHVQAAVPRLVSDCAVPAAFSPSEVAPFDLDWCTIGERDDVRSLLLDIANRWPGAMYVRAPSRTLTVETDTTSWATDPAAPVKTFMLLEDRSPANKFTIVHRGNPSDKVALWRFANFNAVKIGGSNLSITFKGTHPGLGTGVTGTNAGLLDFRSNDGGTPTLLDVRANVHDAHDYGFYVGGSVYGTTLSGKRDRIKQLNLAGRFWNAPVFVAGSVQNLWYDPDRLVISDPYNRTWGWDGVVAGTYNGVKVGCIDNARSQNRTSGGSFYYVDKATGGLTIEYGTLNFIPRAVGAIGNSVSDPFVVRIKDYARSGPQNLTGYPSGVAAKKNGEANFFKGDPHTELGHDKPFRFVRFEMLPPDYGNGGVSRPIKSGCAPDNMTSNNFNSGDSNFLRLEANRGNQSYRNVNAFWDVQLAGNFNNFTSRGPLLYTAFGMQDTPGPTEPDRSYGHVIRATAGTVITDTVNLLDTITVTGEGTWTNLTIKSAPTRSGKTLNPKSNTVSYTTVTGVVDIGPHAAQSKITNVDFGVGAARTIVRVDANSDVAISNICAPAGSVIEGRGVATYNGQQIALPFIMTATRDCQLSADSKPNPASPVQVEEKRLRRP